MQSTLLAPGAARLLASTAYTVDVASAVITLPLADCYAFIIDVTAATGTSPTADVNIQVTVDGGTTFYTAYRFAQIATTGIRRINVQGQMGRGEAGTEAAIGTTGGALVANTILTRKIRVYVDMGGTNPSITFVLYALFMPRTTGGY